MILDLGFLSKVDQGIDLQAAERLILVDVDTEITVDSRALNFAATPALAGC